MAIPFLLSYCPLVRQALIILKKTKFELDEERYPDREFYAKITSLQNNCYERIYRSHLRQLESRKILQEIFGHENCVFRDEFDRKNPSDYEYLIALGGDNHFTYVAHYAKGTKVIGCNSDVKTSRGVLLGFSPEMLRNAVENNFQDTEIMEWSMIYGRLDYPEGTFMETVGCVNEISIRNMSPDLTSRYLIRYKDSQEEQKSSGLLLYTGAGSTGWYSSCLGLSGNDQQKFPKDAPYFGVFARELSHRARLNFKLNDFIANGSITVISEMNGGISIDSLPERIYHFPPGTIGTFQLSSHKLKTVVPKQENNI